jgi:mRNA interferase RelE/StbE
LAWTIEIDSRAARALKKLDRTIQREIADFLLNRIAKAESPRIFGMPLQANKFGLWRYRVRDYRQESLLFDFVLDERSKK